jgi:4,5-DOPA dioxygenase extradiol
MTTRQPVLFVSHGAPDLLMAPGATGRLWAELGRHLPRPTAILAISAHWESARPAVSATAQPATLHDFGGFAAELYAMQYPVPGAVRLAERAALLLDAAGLSTRVDTQRGLDHGAWVPLRLMHPAADIPVSQLSVQPHAGPSWHRQVGAALRPLRDEGVLILASGAVTHNFAWLYAPGAPAYPPAVEFAHWLAHALANGGEADPLSYRTLAPHGAEAHPTEEHLLPIFVALGATDERDSVQRLGTGFTYGGLAMDAYLWQTEGKTFPFVDNLQ